MNKSLPFFFEGEGAVQSLLRQKDWSDFPYGSPVGWPAKIRNTINMVLSAQTPMSFCWGPQLYYFYNDSYAALIGAKHPSALTRPFWESWPEIRESFMPFMQRCLNGEFQSIENMEFMIERQGKLEPAFYTFSLLPIRTDHGEVQGILNPVIETTGRIISTRAQEFQLQLADRIRSIADPNDIIAAACELLGQNLKVALVGYLEVDESGQRGFLRRDWTNGELPTMAGQTLHLDAFGPELAEEVRQGRVIAVEDVTTDSRSADYTNIYAASGTQSYMAIPLLKEGKLRSIVCLHQPKPHIWSRNAVALAREMVDRTWIAVESARAQAQQRETAERLQFVLDAAQIGEWHLDLISNTAVRSLRHDQCFGYTEPVSEWTVEKALAHVHPDDRPRVKEIFEKALRDLSDWRFECRVIWPDSSIHWISAHGSVYTVNGQPTHMTGIVFDITERKEADERLRHAAMHDPLTGLPNRAMLFEYAEHLLPHNRRNNRCAAVLFLDLDRFKPINDTHGHEVGDQLLKEAANRLSRTLRAEDIVSRLGGDEFVVLLQDICDKKDAAEAARHIIDKLSKPFHIHDLTL
ncbi:MAG TPA: diguanylate cyclase, partial [Methylophilaceae bacterium]|nr:diguanylate cyclase [Methylophilaceae bacterium]